MSPDAPPSEPAPVRVLTGVEVVRLFVSPGHNYFGHHGREPGTHPVIEVPRVRCVAGLGLEGDRFFAHRPGYKGQVTFLSEEVFRTVCAAGGWRDREPSATRRNVIIRGIDLDTLIGVDFELQGVRFHGSEECRPCEWMDQALGPGAEKLLRGRGGLRARVLSDGILTALEYAGPNATLPGGAPP